MRKNEVGKGIEFYATEGKKLYKGVIKDWDKGMKITELVEAIDDTSKIVSMERIARRYYGKEEKITKKRYGDDILIIMEEEGNERIKRKELRIYDNITGLKVRPFVEPVKQCFNCFRYGYLKIMCRSMKGCIICVSKEHGICQKREQCVNCGENHRSTSKRCSVHL